MTRVNGSLKEFFIPADKRRPDLRTKHLKYVKTLHKVEKAWTIGGKIFCEMKKIPGRHADNTKPVIVKSPDDLFKLGETSVDWGQLCLAHLEDGSC